MGEISQKGLFEAKTYNADTIEALANLALTGLPDGYAQVYIDPSLCSVEIRVEGVGFDGAIPGEQLRTLWEVQQNFYRLAALSLKNSFDIRVLTAEERNLFEIKVTTQKGSWISQIITSDFWSALFANNPMNGNQMLATVIICSLIAGGIFYYNAKSKRLEIVEKVKVYQKTYEVLTKLADSFNLFIPFALNKLVAQTQNTITTTAEQVAKRSHNAEKIRVSGIELDKEAIEKYKERAKPDTEVQTMNSSLFLITELDKTSPSWSMKVEDQNTKETLTVKVIPEAIDGNGSQIQDLINNSFHDDTPLLMEISVGRKRNLLISAEVQN